MHRIELSIVEERPGARTPITVLPTKYVESSLSLSVEREERAEALAYALDVLRRLSVAPDASTGTLWQCCNRNPHPLDGSCSEQGGRTQDAVKDADTAVAIARRVKERLTPLIAEIAADPGGEWYNGAAESTMDRLYANIVKAVTDVE